MPVVPTYKADSVRQRPATDAKMAGPVPGQFGEAVGQALGRAAQDFGQAQQIAAQQQDMADHTAAKQLDSEYAAFERETLWTGDAAVYKQQGRNAISAADQANTALADKARELSARATSPQQAAMFGEVADNRLTTSLDGLARFRAQAEKDDYLSTSAARLVTQRDYAAATWANPEEQRLQIETGRAELADQAQHGGWSPELYKVKELEFTTGVHASAVEQMMGTGGGADALAYLRTHEREMDPHVAYQLKTQARELADVYGAASAVAAVEMHGMAPAAAAAGTAAVPTGAGARRVADIVAKAGGTPDEVRAMVAMGAIESSFDPKARNGSSEGLFQFKAATFSENGGKDINSFEDQTSTAFRLYRKNQARLTKILGRPAAPWELYLAHQQGDGGGPSLLTAPRDMNAIQALLPVYPGAPNKARRAIIGNAPIGSGINEASTVGDFLDAWQADVTRRLGGGSPVPAIPTSGPANTPFKDLPDRDGFVRQAVALAPSNDPRTVAKYRAAAEARWSDMKQSHDEAERNAVDAAQPYLRDPNIRTVSQYIAAAGPTLWAAIPEKTKTEIVNHYGSGGYAKDSDPIALAALYDMQAHNPKGFAAMDLTGQTAKLDAGDYGKMLEAQKVIRGGGGPAKDHEVTASRVMSVSTQLLRSVGIEPTTKAKGRAADVAKFQNAMMQSVDAYKRMNNGAVPDDAAILKMADTLLLDGTYAGEGGLLGANTVHAKAFQVPPGRRFEYKVPGVARGQIVRDFTRAFKRPPTDAEVQGIYRREHANGRF